MVGPKDNYRISQPNCSEWDTKSTSLHLAVVQTSNDSSLSVFAGTPSVAFRIATR